MAPELILLTIIVLAMMAYAVLGGADFGAGVWEFNTALRAPEEERHSIYRAIGPVWEANHVWLIFAMVGLFGGFPIAFAAIFQALFLPLLLALAGIVFRGAAYAFRSYAPDNSFRRMSEGIFALASVAAPFFFGMGAGTMVGGEIRVGTDLRFVGSFTTDWISPFSIMCGFFAVGICAYMAAVFMTRESGLRGNDHDTQLWRRRAVSTGVVTGVVSLATLAIGLAQSTQLREGFQDAAWPMVVLALLTGFASIWLLKTGRFTWTTLTAALTIASVVGGGAISHGSDLLPGQISVAEAAAPDNVTWTFLAVIGMGALVLVPSLGWLLYLFKVDPRTAIKH